MLSTNGELLLPLSWVVLLPSPSWTWARISASPPAPALSGMTGEEANA
jgi:hypothetical protein